ncbi:hypothetical protein TNCV_2997921 [Trichonephila clavipes]|nr:hypothetical protein TNCV_2997921 [Trichonephila clavipes]
MSSHLSTQWISIWESAIRNCVDSTMGDFTYAENADMHYDLEKGNGRDALRMYRSQFPNRRILVHRIFQRLHHQLRETRLFHVTSQRWSTKSCTQSKPECILSILNVVYDRPESSTRSVAHHVSVNHQTVCRM